MKDQIEQPIYFANSYDQLDIRLVVLNIVQKEGTVNMGGYIGKIKVAGKFLGGRGTWS